MKYLYWALPVGTALAYGVWRYFAGQVYVGALPPFDLHLYSFEQAQAYLAGLTPTAKAIYLGPLHRADSVLMICLAASLIAAVWRRGWLWAVPALLYLCFDLAENRLVTSVLETGIPGGAATDTLRIVTGLKFGCLGLAAALALASLWRKRRLVR
ncbi:MAG: hypothetical protein U1A24_14610 [Cypionkella sp.]|uniref:hypothetical protein n=1 Tax=Cypionkella sp. TaxID=2811411 RepID=UPI002ABA2AE4|nr:hypothetical protein [Cypionkella sp.]MDZ4311774.1 hypothetical protein [Cypionkella sp.]